MNEQYYRLSTENSDELLRRLRADHDVWAPAVMPREGRHSDQPVIGYRPVSSSEEIVWDQKTFFSPKEAVFPIRETLFHFVDGQAVETTAPSRPLIVFLRPCDINGIGRCDGILLRNGETADYYYERRRRLIKFFMIECVEGFDSCFCISMGADRTDEYAAAFRVESDGLSVVVRDEELAPLFDGFPGKEAFAARFPERNAVTVRIPDPEKIDEAVMEHEMWQEYSRRCIACGRCNTSCPTCTCFSMQDVFYDGARTMGERRRAWTGCHLDGFADMAGGHTFRATYGARMRFKVLHKVYDYHKRFGAHMCVGCGRCDDVCPEYISYSKCVNRLSDLVGEKPNS
jgi:anaerobic sulfite reductase subunit A